MTEHVPNRLVICEGPSDKVFLQRLLESKNLSIPCIRYPGDKKQNTGKGIDGFRGQLLSMKVDQSERPKFNTFEKILFVADKDGNAENNLTKVRSAIQKVFPKRVVPTQEGEVQDGHPSFQIILLPTNYGEGSLDNLLIEIANDTETKEAIDYFLSRLPRDRMEHFGENVVACGKFMVRSYVAAKARRPDDSIAKALKQDDSIFDFDSGVLDPLIETLETFLG